MALRRASVKTAPALQTKPDQSQQLPNISRIHPRKQIKRTVSHGKGSRSGSILSLDDLISTELDPLDESSVRLSSLLNNRLSLSGLRENRDDGDSRVSTDNGHVGLSGEGTGDGGEEGGRSHDVKGRDSEETAGSGSSKHGRLGGREGRTNRLGS